MNLLKNFFESFGNWQVPPATESQLKKADCIVGFAFGMRSNNQPGMSNELLAEAIFNLHQQYRLPLMLQWELTETSFKLDLPEHRIVRKHRTPGKYLDTFEVADQMAKELLYEKLYRPIVVAHPHHMWRCLKTMEKRTFIPFAAETKNVPYDKQSTQFWTKRPEYFIPREILFRMTMSAIGKL